VQDALQQKHVGPIWLFHGGRNPFSLYLKEELQQIALHNQNFQYRPSVLSGALEGIPEIALDRDILENFPDLKKSRIYLCGDPSLVNLLRKKLFLAGASSKEIYADAFLPSSA
jgi:NAD(P)H-flavin reductase